MLLKNLFACMKTYVLCIPFFLAATLITACNRLPVTNEKPVFIIANMPSFTREKTSPNQGDVLETKPEETISLENKKDEQLSEPKSLESVIKDTLPEETLKDKDAIESKITSEELTVNSHIEVKKELNKPADKPEEDKETIGTLQKPAGKQSLKPKSLTSNEIASLIRMPPSDSLPPPLERIKLEALKNIKDKELIFLMGKPDFVLRNNQMILWQYKVGECIIDFFLRQNEFNHFVTYIDIRAQILGNKINKQTCELELSNALNS